MGFLRPSTQCISRRGSRAESTIQNQIKHGLSTTNRDANRRLPSTAAYRSLTSPHPAEMRPRKVNVNGAESKHGLSTKSHDENMCPRSRCTDHWRVDILLRFRRPRSTDTPPRQKLISQDGRAEPKRRHESCPRAPFHLLSDPMSYLNWTASISP